LWSFQFLAFEAARQRGFFFCLCSFLTAVADGGAARDVCEVLSEKLTASDNAPSHSTHRN
jgi:hypothetical protein